ncbi:Uncharacterized protein OS=Haliangium ochraceum (strain DSM 14365 / JCM 11303 / SMP-2) GN=Hoch_2832 PE=4 SV=1 [Gemmata massiliana]|uniref:Uncharacterized protein n=1 Tax=Gemmata massiliana TaxID=1210884 RepID=A0A6P2D174_9BACT|nr:hypothetical protein [Gemmata massiliana]VTR93162.1 Uncharacterized protein OS=Haliangium ochraceum (strain DSM 14365 / JCM 11303 / SMP-2) GN=Hoch_2832 PE=4 SV=1 [Gemmata massiliana]
MNPSTWQPFEHALGRELAPDEIGSVHNLNAFPPALIAEACRLPTLLRRDYLRALVDRASRGNVIPFEDAVFNRGEDPKTWCRGGVIGPWLTTHAELGSLSVEEILAPLGHPRGEPWVRMSIDVREWRNRNSFAGAPVIPCEDADYRTVFAPRTMRLLPSRPPLPSLPPLLPVTDIAVATRRWLASQLAQVGRPRERLDDPVTVEELCDRIGVHSLSDDATIAVRALIAERALPAPPDGVPGFIGPDSWYADPLRDASLCSRVG